MKGIKSMLAILLLTGIVGVSATPIGAQEGVILKVRAGQTNYCHMKFPAIRGETLYWDRPVLKDARDGDIIDFYGPCNHDPLGKDEVSRQRAELHRRLIQDQE